MISSPTADNAFERTVNHPPRGIGQKTIDEIRAHARDRLITLWDASLELVVADRLSARARSALQAYVDLVKRMTSELGELPLGEQIRCSVEISGLDAHFKKDNSEKGQSRLENLQELVGAGKGFEYDAVIDENLSVLDAFLAHAALEAGEAQGDAWDDCVQLMTMHSVKGLEFPLVFLVGMEEGLFPHQRSSEEPGRMEEERRLCYVGATRAMSQLYVSHAEQRRMYGTSMFAQASRFLPPKPSATFSATSSPSTDPFPSCASNACGLPIRTGRCPSRTIADSSAAIVASGSYSASTSGGSPGRRG